MKVLQFVRLALIVTTLSIAMILLNENNFGFIFWTNLILGIINAFFYEYDNQEEVKK